jgi:hypothetical protein
MAREHRNCTARNESPMAKGGRSWEAATDGEVSLTASGRLRTSSGKPERQAMLPAERNR